MKKIADTLNPPSAASTRDEKQIRKKRWEGKRTSERIERKGETRGERGGGRTSSSFQKSCPRSFSKVDLFR